MQRRSTKANGARLPFFPKTHIESLEQRCLLSGVAAITELMLVETSLRIPVVKPLILTNGATIDLAQTGRQVSVLAVPGAGQLGSIRFNLDGDASYRIDNAAPYAIAGGTVGPGGKLNFEPWVPNVGLHSLVVTAYANPSGTGDRGATTTVQFNVIDSSKSPLPSRINAGGPAFTDAAGDAFAADHFFTGGTQSTAVYAVAGTADDQLYESTRTGRMFSFNETVSPGTYSLKLGFADPVSGKAGQRVFSVFAGSTPLLQGFDIFAAAGAARTAVDRTFTIYVPDGHVHLAFQGVYGKAIVSAVELVAADRAPTVPAPFYVNAGGGAFTDVLGRPFDGNNGFIGGTSGSYTAIETGNAISQALSTFRQGSSFTFDRPVADGHYELWLEFSDPASVPDQRVFNVFAEGTELLTNFDIARQVPDPNASDYGVSSVTEAFNVNVADGSMDLTFQGVTGNAIVSAIIVLPTDIPAATLPYSVQAGSDTSRNNASLLNLHNLGFELFDYANDHQQNFPTSLAQVYAYGGGAFSESAYVGPRTDTLVPRGELSMDEQVAWVNTLQDYLYINQGRNPDAGVILVYENPSRVIGNINVLYGDGSTGTITRDQLAVMVPGSLDHVTMPTIPTYPAQTVDPAIVQSAVQLEAISTAILAYQLDNQFRYPADLGTILANENITINNFVDPRRNTVVPVGLTDDQAVAFVDSSTDYIYLGNKAKFNSPADTVLAYENPADNANGILFLFADGRVEFRETQWALETIARGNRANVMGQSNTIEAPIQPRQDPSTQASPSRRIFVYSAPCHTR